MGRLLSLLFIWRTFLMVPVCGPSPEPGTNWRIKMCSPAFEEDGRRGPRCFSGAENRATALCHRHCHGGSPSIRVWCSHMGVAPAQRNHVRTRCQRITTPASLRRRKKAQNPLFGAVCLLTTGGLIRVRGCLLSPRYDTPGCPTRPPCMAPTTLPIRHANGD
jgi:hypothetical protein